MTTGVSLEELEELSRAARDITSRRLEERDRARDEQPTRLAEARAKAEQARTDALAAEPWDDLYTAVPIVEGGELTGMFGVPSVAAKELMGARLAFEAIDCGDDDVQVDAVLNRVFTMVHGDAGHALLIFSAALRTIDTLVVPQLLTEIEYRASNYNVRVTLADAVWKAWNARVHNLDDDAESDQ